MSSLKGTVYLLHLSRKLAGHAGHYIGWTDGPPALRVETHRMRAGAAMLAAAVERGIPFRLVRVWEGRARGFERSLKNRKNAPYLCPVCRARALARRRRYERRQRARRKMAGRAA